MIKTKRDKAITIKDENTGCRKTVCTSLELWQIAKLMREQDAARDKMQQAYIVEKPDYAIIGLPMETGRTRYLCLQEGVRRRAIVTITVDIEMHRIADPQRCGLSRKGSLAATYADICEVFGPPNQDFQDQIDDKIDIGWEGSINQQDFSIHNYKDGPRYLKAAGTPITQISNWGIYTHKQQVADLVTKFYETRKVQRHV